MADLVGENEKAPHRAGLLTEAQEALVRQIVQDEVRKAAMLCVMVAPEVTQEIPEPSPSLVPPDQGCGSRAPEADGQGLAELSLLVAGGRVLPLRKLIEILRLSSTYPRRR